jgi:repressor LexA
MVILRSSGWDVKQISRNRKGPPKIMTTKRGITKRQQELLDFIRDFTKSSGYPPSLREMAEGLGVKSDQAVIELLGRLERHRALKRTPGVSRSVVLL